VSTSTIFTAKVLDTISQFISQTKGSLVQGGDHRSVCPSYAGILIHHVQEETLLPPLYPQARVEEHQGVHSETHQCSPPRDEERLDVILLR